MTESEISYLSDEDLSTIDVSLIPRVVNLQDKLRQQIESNNSWERYKVGSEQCLYEVGQRLEMAQSQLEKETKSAVSLKQQLQDVESDRNHRIRALRELETQTDAVSVQRSNLQRRVDLLSNDKEDLNALLEKRNDEIKTIRAEIEQLKNDHKSLVVEKCSIQVKLNQVNDKELELQHRESRFDQERELWSKEKEWMNNELAARDQNIFALRKQMSLKEVESESKVAQLSDEITQVSFNCEKSKEEQNKLSEQLQELIQRLKDASEERSSLQESYDRELESKTKLTELLKQSSKEAESKIEELTATLESNLAMFNESKNNFLTMQQEMKQICEEHEKIVKEKTEDIDNYKDELQKANELLRSQNRVMLTDEEVAAISPAAASAARLIKSGVSITSIYREHCKVVDELNMQKIENKRIEAYFKELVTDIENKAPIIKRQKEEYLHSLQTVDRLKDQLSNVAEEQRRLVNSRDSALRQLAYTKAELERFQRDNSDLSSQVRGLMRCLETNRAGEEYPSLMQLSSDVLPGAEHLVMFRNIDELQANNQRLLSSLREAEARREEIIKQTQEAEMSKLHQELGVAKKEVESLEEHREKQNLVLESLAQQRDSYKKLYNDKIQETPQEMLSSGNEMVISPNLRSNSQESSRLLDRVNAEFDLYRKEKQEIQGGLNTKVDELQEYVGQLRASNAKLNAEVEYQAERFRVLNSNTENTTKQLNLMQERLTSAQNHSNKQDQIVSELTREVISARESVGKLSAEKQSYMDQLNNTKCSMDRMSVELETVRSHSFKQEHLTLSLQELQARLDRNDSERSLNITKELEATRIERNSLQKAYAQLNEQQQIFVRDSKAKLHECQAQLSEEETKNKQMAHKLSYCEEELKSSNEKVAKLQAQLDAFTSGDISTDRYQKENQILQNRLNLTELQLNEIKTQLISVTEQLKATEAQISRHSQISLGLEGSLKELTKVEGAEKAELSRKLEETTLQLESKTQEIERLSKDIDGLTQALTQLRQEENRANQQNTNKQTIMQTQIQSLTEEVKTWTNRETAAIIDRDQHIQIATDLQTKLTQQLTAATINEAKQTKLEEQILQLSQKIASLQNTTDNEKQMTQTQLMNLEQQLTAANSEKQQAKNTMLDLQSQNTSLFDQVEKLGVQIQVLEKCKPTESSGVFEESTHGEKCADSESVVSPLMDVIKFAREEKRKAQAKADMTETELIRIKAQRTTMEQEIDRLNKLYNDAKIESEAYTTTVNERSMLSARLQALQSVQETNQTLTNDLNNLQIKYTAIEQRMSRTVSEVTQEQKKVSDLSSQFDNANGEVVKMKKSAIAWKDKYEKLVEQRNTFDSQQVQQLRKEAQFAQNRISELETFKSKLETEMKEMKSKMESVLGDCDEFKSQNIALDERVTQAEAQAEKDKRIMAQARGLARRYKDQFENLKKATEGKQETAAQNQAAQNQEIGPQSSSVREQLLQAELMKARGEIQETEKVGRERDVLKAELEICKKRVGELEKAGGGKPLIIRNLNTQVNKQMTLMKDMGEKAKQLKDDLTRIKEENESLHKHNEQIDNELKQRGDELKRLNEQAAEDKARLETLKSQFGKARDDNTRLNQQVLLLQKLGNQQQTVAALPPVIAPVQPVAAMQQLPDRPGPSSAFGRNRVAAKVSGTVRPLPAKARASVPPHSTVSPGPSLPDQSNTTSRSAAVPPIVVSTSQQASPSLPHAIVTPHIENQQQLEAVSASTDTANSGISSSSSNNAPIIDLDQDQASTSTDRKRRVTSVGVPVVKRWRADSPSQVSTSGQSTSAPNYAMNLEHEIAPDREADALGGDSLDSVDAGAVESSLQDEVDDEIMVVEEVRPTPASSAEVASSSSTHEVTSFRPDAPVHADGGMGDPGQDAEAISFDGEQLEVDDGIVPAPTLSHNRRQPSAESSSHLAQGSNNRLDRVSPDFPSTLETLPASSNSLARDVPNARQSSPPQVCLASGEVGQSGLGSGIGIEIDDNGHNFECGQQFQYQQEGDFECGLPDQMLHMDEHGNEEEEDDVEIYEQNDVPGEMLSDDQSDVDGDVDVSSDEEQDISELGDDDEREGEATPTPIEVDTGNATDEDNDISQPSTSNQTGRKQIKLRKPADRKPITWDEPPELQQSTSGTQRASPRGRMNIARRSRGSQRARRGRPF